MTGLKKRPQEISDKSSPRLSILRVSVVTGLTAHTSATNNEENPWNT